MSVTRFHSSRSMPGQSSFELSKDQAANDLQIRHGLLLSHAIVVGGSSKRLFRLPPQGLRCVARCGCSIGWRRRPPPCCEPTCFAACSPLTILSALCAANTPFDVVGVLLLVGPLLAARALLALVAPHALQFFISAAAYAGIAALDGLAVYRGEHWLRLLTLAIAAGCALSDVRAWFLYRRFRITDPRQTVARAASIGALLVAVAVGAWSARDGFELEEAGSPVEGVYQSAELGVTVTFPAGWRKAPTEARLDKAERSARWASFFRGRTKKQADAALHIVVYDLPATSEAKIDDHFVETTRQLAKAYSEGFADGASWSITECSPTELSGRRFARCLGSDGNGTNLTLYAWMDRSTLYAALFLLDFKVSLSEVGEILRSIQPIANSPSTSTPTTRSR